MSEITVDTLFTKASRDIKLVKYLDNNVLLELYGLFKKVTVGNNNLQTPSIFDIKATAKYNAWKKLDNIDNFTVKVRYIKLVRSILEKNEKK